MIVYLDGRLVEKEPMRLVLDVQGVGYEVAIPLSSYDRLPAPGSPLKLLIYDHIREDLHQLYGFGTEEERALFLRLLEVSGIGPKLALAALSGLSVRELTAAIVQGDVKRLSTISGIGKKTAERMIVDLRDRLGKGAALAALAEGAAAAPGQQRLRDAILALISLGHKPVEAQKLVQDAAGGLPPTAPVEELVRRALAR